MTSEKIYDYELYTFPIGEKFNRDPEDFYIIYSPLSKKNMLCSKAEKDHIKKCLHDEDADNKNLLDSLELSPKKNIKYDISCPQGIGDIRKMSFLPTHKCNFSCSYCFSAEGRSTEVISEEKAKKAIDFFINPERTNKRELWLAILGGGEPLTEIDFVERMIAYARKRSWELGFKLGIGLTTNGSIINERLIRIIKENYVVMSVSFEVLEDIQNLQRKNYDLVSRNISTMLDSGIELTIKSIITPDNVTRLEEMIEHLHTEFPKVKAIKLQPVESTDIFKSEQELASFYQTFTDNFFKAKRKADAYGIDMYCVSSKFSELIMEHFCGNEICVTPNGKITICHRISSDKEDSFSKFNYGNIANDGIKIDDKTLTQLARSNVGLEECSECFAKWHCAGGCLIQRHIYDDSMFSTICEWNRNFLKEILFRRLIDEN